MHRSLVPLLALLALAGCHRPTADISTSPDRNPKVRGPEKGGTAKPAKDETSGARWVDLAIQSEFGCAVERTGAVYCWGRGPDADMSLRELPKQPVSTDPYAMYSQRKWGPASRLEIVQNAKAIGASRSRACAIVDDGRVRCWGSVQWGSSHVWEIAGLRDAIDIEVGESEACATLEGGAIWCFSATDYEVPRQRLDNAIALAVSDSLACGLTNAGAIVCWGQSVSDWRKYQSGWSGMGPTPPVEGEEPPSDVLEVGRFRGAVDLSISWNNLCVLRSDGKVVCSDRDVFAVLRGEEMVMREVVGVEGAVELVASSSHNCARNSEGRVLCWGRNVYGQLGDGSAIRHDEAVAAKDLHGALGLSVAEDFSCARTGEGISCWGFDRGEAITYEETHVNTLADLRASSIEANGRTTCAVDQNKLLRCWGNDNIEALGIATAATPTSVTVPMQELTGLLSSWEACYLSSDGNLSCGSWNWYTPQPSFQITSTATAVHALAVGQPPSCTIEGQGKKAQLLCGASISERKPVPEVKAPKAMTARNMRACVADESGSVGCFGFMYTWDRPPPPLELTKVGVTKIEALGSASYHDCAISKGGRLSCWVGRTESEWTDDGQPKAIHYKVQDLKEMPELGEVVQVVGTNAMLCALDKAGAVKCWDDNPYVGEGTRWMPTPTLEPVAEMAAGTDHMCVRHVDGRVTCWGDDVWGQLGKIPSRVHLVPTPVPID